MTESKQAEATERLKTALSKCEQELLKTMRSDKESFNRFLHDASTNYLRQLAHHAKDEDLKKAIRKELKERW